MTNPRRSWQRVVALGLTSILLVAMAACGNEDDDPEAAPQVGNERFKVGVILPKSGPAAAIGTDFETALDVFSEVDPTAAELDVEFVICDDKTTPDGAAACARKLVQQDNVDMIYGPVIAGAHAGATPILEGGPPAIASSPYVVPDPEGPIFNVYGSAYDMDQTVLQLAADRGYERVAVLATTDETGTVAVENLERANEDLDLALAIERMGPTDVDASAQLNRLLQRDPEFVYVSASGAAAGVALKGLQQLGVDVPTALAGSNTTIGFLTAAKGSFPSETLFAVTPSWVPDELEDEERAEQIRMFQDAFEEAAGGPVSFVVQSVYDAFQVIHGALAEVGSDPEAIIEYLESFEEEQTLNWKHTFSSDAHAASDSGNWVMARYDDDEGTWSLADGSAGG